MSDYTVIEDLTPYTWPGVGLDQVIQSPKQIEQLVMKVFKRVGDEEILHIKSRKLACSELRMICMALSFKHLHISLKEVGDYWGMSRCMVIHAKNKVFKEWIDDEGRGLKIKHIDFLITNFKKGVSNANITETRPETMATSKESTGETIGDDHILQNSYLESYPYVETKTESSVRRVSKAKPINASNYNRSHQKDKPGRPFRYTGRILRRSNCKQ